MTAILLLLMTSLGPVMVTSAQTAPTDAIYINEILVSPNNEQYDGTDWNGDGSTGIYSDQFVELHNPTSCLLYTSPSPRDRSLSRMPSSA